MPSNEALKKALVYDSVTLKFEGGGLQGECNYANGKVNRVVRITMRDTDGLIDYHSLVSVKNASGEWSGFMNHARLIHEQNGKLKEKVYIYNGDIWTGEKIGSEDQKMLEKEMKQLLATPEGKAWVERKNLERRRFH